MYVGMRVQIDGLQSRPELNGKVGMAAQFDSKRGRYAVEVSGEAIMLKAGNLSLAPDAPESELTPEDDGLELLECARYGEDEELSAMLAKGTPVDFCDGQGNMAIHRASANGHTNIVRLLAAAGSPHVPNASGNTPLHWAVQQGHLEATKALLELYPDADVLAQNSFGKSVSSEAFAKGVPELVEAVLQHKSAAKLEETAEGGGGEGEGGGASGGEGDGSRMEGEATHAFRFGAGDDSPVVHVRELGELGAEDHMRVLGRTADSDRTGLQLWAASLVLSRWLVDLAPQIRGKGVIELGAGCGLCGIVAAKHCGATSVAITDLAEETMSNLRHNLSLNGLQAPACLAQSVDWRNRTTWPAAQPVIIGADLIYALEAVGPLVECINAMLAPNGAFLYVCPETNRQGEQEFLTGLCASGFEVQQSSVPPSYLANAFADDSFTDEDFYLLFSELKQRTYTLYCFTRIGDVALPEMPPEVAAQAAAQAAALRAQFQAEAAAAAASSSTEAAPAVELTISPEAGGDGQSVALRIASKKPKL
jgi:hypothetical protein